MYATDLTNISPIVLSCIAKQTNKKAEKQKEHLHSMPLGLVPFIATGLSLLYLYNLDVFLDIFCEYQ